MPDSPRWCEHCVGHGHHHTATHPWTVIEVAGRLRVSRMTIYRLIEAGELPATRVGRSLRIYDEHLTAYLNGTAQ